MRHFLANIALYLIAIFLLTTATFFGWLRSAQLVVTSEPTVLARFAPAPAYAFDWVRLGENVYRRNCQNCHGANGQGWDQYPGLDNTVPIFLTPGGRDLLVDLHLYGLTSGRWGAPMPVMGHLQDVQLAAVLNHLLTRFGQAELLGEDAALYAPRDIRARRGRHLSPWQVEEERTKVVGNARR